MKKKLLSLTMALSIMATMGTSVFASDYESISNESDASYYNSVASRASNYFTGQTGTMNSLYGGSSTVNTISSGSVINGGLTSNVSLTYTVSSGSNPVNLCVVDPNGKTYTKPISSSGTLNTDFFNGYSPAGKWYVYITGASTVATVSARMTVTYTY